jgi:uncharacterized protein (DUF2141 family)
MKRILIQVNNTTIGKNLYIAIHKRETWLKKPYAYIVEQSLAQSFMGGIDLPFGEYAIAVFEDIFESGEIVFNFFNIPKNPIGFSKNPSLFGKPSFDDCSFDVKDNTNLKVLITLKTLI